GNRGALGMFRETLLVYRQTRSDGNACGQNPEPVSEAQRSEGAGDVRDTFYAKDAAVAGDLRGWAEGFLEIVRGLDRGRAFRVVQLTDHIEGIEGRIGSRAAIAEVVGQQGAPASAEADAALRQPFFGIEKIGGTAEIRWAGAAANLSGKLRVQGEDGINVEGVRGDEEFLARVAGALLEPGDVLIAGKKGILAVGALPGPVGNPFW